MLGWPQLEKNGRPLSHDVSSARLALTTETTAGVDVTGRLFFTQVRILRN